jgi:hypothetical protein
MVQASVEILNRPGSLPRFLALWWRPILLLYCWPWRPSWASWLLARRAMTIGQYAAMIVSLCLLPAGLAFGQWVLMRRYLRKRCGRPRPSGAVLGNSPICCAEATGETLGSFPQLNWVFTIVGPILGGDRGRHDDHAACGPGFGAAWSIPQGLALPGARAKMFWMSVMMLTAFTVVVMTKTLSAVMEAQMHDFSPPRF